MTTRLYDAHRIAPADGTDYTVFVDLRTRQDTLADPVTPSTHYVGPMLVGLHRWEDGLLDVTTLIDPESNAYEHHDARDVIVPGRDALIATR